VRSLPELSYGKLNTPPQVFGGDIIDAHIDFEECLIRSGLFRRLFNHVHHS